MPPLTVSLSWGTVFIPYLYGPTLDHPWGGKGVTEGVRLKGWDFLVTLLPTFQTTPASRGHLHPLWALIPKKRFSGDRSFPKRTNYAIGFPALVGGGLEGWDRLASPWSGGELLHLEMCFGVYQVEADLNLQTHLFSPVTIQINQDPLCSVEDGRFESKCVILYRWHCLWRKLGVRFILSCRAVCSESSWALTSSLPRTVGKPPQSL